MAYGHFPPTIQQVLDTSTSKNVDVVDPTNTDDAYDAGTLWVNTAASKVFVCLEKSPNAAVWLDITPSEGGGPFLIQSFLFTSSTGTAFRFHIPADAQDGGYTNFRLYGIAAIAGGMSANLTFNITAAVFGNPVIDSAVVNGVPGMGNATVIDLTFDLPDYNTYNASTVFVFEILSSGDPATVNAVLQLV